MGCRPTATAGAGHSLPPRVSSRRRPQIRRSLACSRLIRSLGDAQCNSDHGYRDGTTIQQVRSLGEDCDETDSSPDGKECTYLVTVPNKNF